MMDIEVEPDLVNNSIPATASDAFESINNEKDSIIDYLTNIDAICFKSQQIGESDLNKQEKVEIASEIFEKSKLNFLMRFGKYLQSKHLNYFKQFTEDNNSDNSYEINLILNDLTYSISNNHQIKNRRFEAMKQLLEEDSYFSEAEMMKRDPLLYEQLVGQYLSAEEKKERDQIAFREKSGLVAVLMEGIERDDAELKRKDQKHQEEEEEEEEDDDDDSDVSLKSCNSQPCYSRWGEFEDEEVVKKKSKKKSPVTLQEQQLLKEEFISLMYQNFLDGKDEDFNYDAVDNNEKYDSMDVKELDDEDKYFDSEEPDLVATGKEESSEDELDIYMNSLNQHPAVCELSKNLQKL